MTRVYALPLPNPQGLEIPPSLPLVLITAGTFQMGSNEEHDDEKPQHSVTLTEDFLLGQFPLTQRQWESLGTENPSHFIGQDRPVDNVSHNMITDWLDALHKQTGYRLTLPTEAQWEYAACGGEYYEKLTYAGSDRLEDVGWFRDNSYRESKPVGLKLPNALGLYDMSGNVLEWCLDGERDYQEKAETDPRGPETQGVGRVLRGGCWFFSAVDCRCSGRDRSLPGLRGVNLGFRVALSAQSKTAEHLRQQHLEEKEQSPV